MAEIAEMARRAKITGDKSTRMPGGPTEFDTYRVSSIDVSVDPNVYEISWVVTGGGTHFLSCKQVIDPEIAETLAKQAIEKRQKKTKEESTEMEYIVQTEQLCAFLKIAEGAELTMTRIRDRSWGDG